MITLVPASPAHIGTIAARMRAADRIECVAMGLSPKGALRSGLRASSLCLTAKVDGRAEAMIGLVVANALCGEGVPWLLGTEAVYDHPRAMLRRGPRILAAMLDSTPRLSNLVAVQNIRAIRFLRRLGFAMGGEVIMHGGTGFITSSIERCRGADPMTTQDRRAAWPRH
jgi:hypothetical protein